MRADDNPNGQLQQVAPWLTLKSVTGVGNLLFNRLINRFGHPTKVLTAPAAELVMVDGVSQKLARAIQKHTQPEWISVEIGQAMRKGYNIITMADRQYPALLREIPDPPPVLYVYGRLTPLSCPIAMVGSRNASRYGLSATHKLAARLAERGVTVVSGMARGIDTAAHRGAIEGKGLTVAVLGSGLNRIYPTENLKLFHQIAENGCVVSEFALDAAPKAHHFPMRNRIISGMTLGTVVVEAARRSGSLITARLAAEQNRDVFAVPGSIDAINAKGTHDLIKQGAKLVEDADDILVEIAPQLADNVQQPVPQTDAQPPLLTDREKQVYDAVEVYPVHIDTLSRQIAIPIGELTGILSQLVLRGIIQQEPGKLFFREEQPDT